jgi:hypothetical protein
MNRFSTVLSFAALTLLCTDPVFARQMKVKIDGQGAAEEVAKSIEARLRGTECYVVTDGDAVLVLHINCAHGKDVANVEGYVCSFLYSYSPESMSLLETWVGGLGLVTGRDASSVAEDLFVSFVAATTDEKLEKAEKYLRLGVASYCYNSIPPDKNAKADCGQEPPKH